jgi:double zinc ribbon protein
MSPLAYFGIESSGLNLAIDLLILFVVVVYLSLIYWTYADARRRILDPMLIGCATAASLFPFVGTMVYLILRPPEYLEDVRERELEMQAAEARLHQLDQSLCPHCDYRIERDFIRCPSCLRKLKERCVSCSRPLDQAWTICPYCEADVPGLSPPRSRRRRAALESELAEIPAATAAGATQVAIEPEEPPRPGAAPPAPGLADEAEPIVASEATRPRGSGRSRRPSGRARPSS